MSQHTSRSLRSALMVGSALTALSPVAASADTAFTDLGNLGSYSVAYGISADGSTVVGASDPGATSGYYWNTIEGMVGLEALTGAPGDCAAAANAASADGSVIVGYGSDGSTDQAVRWDSGVISVLTNPYASDAEATGVSGDGEVIAGNRDNSGTNEAFVWTSGGGMTVLSGLTGESWAYAVSADGAYVGGSLDDAGTQTAMRWSSGSGAENLGSLSVGGESAVYALNANGSAATGYSYNGVTYEAFRWTADGGMTGLGGLTPGSKSFGQAISADGKIITGQNIDSGTYTAFRWTASSGMVSLTSILDAHGVDYTGWELNDARGISADGKLIVGTGMFGGQQRAYLMTTDGLITPEELAASVAPITLTNQQAQSQFSNYVSQLMFTARNVISTYFSNHNIASANRPLYAANDTGTMSDASPAVMQRTRMAMYATGSVSFGKVDGFSNDGLNGTTGVLFDMGDDLAIGAGVLGNRTAQDTHLGGETRTRTLGGSVLAAYEPSSGLRLYGAAALAAIDVNADRNYLNGVAVDGSRGDTHGYGYALSARGGYEIPLDPMFAVMPYAELEYAKTEIDGYTETGGGIPATVGDQSNDRLVSRLGGELTAKVTDDVTTRLRAAWGHRLSGDNGSVYVTAMGIGQSLKNAGNEDDWAELGASASYDVSKALTVSANLETTLAGSDNRDASVTVGLVYRFN
ncbi:MAG: autotransporter domain-containing protein [Parvibaculaceae bacterium]